MTMQEACRNFQMTEENIKNYEENGLIRAVKKENGIADYLESDLQHIVQLHFLIEEGMNVEELKNFLKLQGHEPGMRKEQIRILRKFRFEILDGIHTKQQNLDRLDYLIHEIRKKGEERNG